MKIRRSGPSPLGGTGGQSPPSRAHQRDLLIIEAWESLAMLDEIARPYLKFSRLHPRGSDLAAVADNVERLLPRLLREVEWLRSVEHPRIPGEVT